MIRGGAACPQAAERASERMATRWGQRVPPFSGCVMRGKALRMPRPFCTSTCNPKRGRASAPEPKHAFEVEPLVPKRLNVGMNERQRVGDNAFHLSGGCVIRGKAILN